MPITINIFGGNRDLRQRLIRLIEERVLRDILTESDGTSNINILNPVELYQIGEPRL